MTVPFVVAIPARLASTRLPQKPLRQIAGKSLLAHVIDRALAAGAGEVAVATDDGAIAQVAKAAGVRAFMTRESHASGTDRIAELAELRGWPDETIVVNLQGDEPLAPPSGIKAVAAVLEASAAPVATLATPVDEPAQLFDPNVVKVVRDAHGLALYFSRAPIPWLRDRFGKGGDRAAPLPKDVPFLRHIGIYAYRAGFLRRFAALSPGSLEQAEALEQLRMLEAGHRIAVGIAPEAFPAGVDTEADLLRVEALLARAPKF